MACRVAATVTVHKQVIHHYKNIITSMHPHTYVRMYTCHYSVLMDVSKIRKIHENFLS